MTELTKDQKIAKIYGEIAQHELVKDNIYKTLPVMLGDVLDWVESNKKDGGLVDHGDGTGHWLDQEIVPIRTYKRKPIESQPEQVVDYVYSLLPTNETNG